MILFIDIDFLSSSFAFNTYLPLFIFIFYECVLKMLK